MGTELRLVPVPHQDSAREAVSRASVIAASSSGLVPSLPLLYLGFPPRVQREVYVFLCDRLTSTWLHGGLRRV